MLYTESEENLGYYGSNKTTEFISTNRGKFIQRLKQYAYHSEEIRIATGYISLKGLQQIIASLQYVDRIKILVGVIDSQATDLIEVINNPNIKSSYTLGEIDIYDLLRNNIETGKLDIIFSKNQSGF